MTVISIKNRISTPLGIILLRNWHLRDEFALQKNANSYAIWKNLADPFPHPYTVDHAREYIDRAVNTRNEKLFAVDFNNEAIGSCGITLKEGIYRGNAELGFWIGERYWNKGIGSHVVKFLSQTAFSQLKVRRIYAKIFSNNISSIKVLQKNGFTLEGTFKNGVIKNDTFLDELIYAKLNPNFDLI